VKAADDATVRRTTLAAAVRHALSADYPPSRKPPRGSIVVEPGGTPGTLRVSRGYEGAPARDVPAEGTWAAHVAVTASVLRDILRTRLPMALRLTFFGGALMVGPTSIPAQDVRPAQGEDGAESDDPPTPAPRQRRPRPKRWRGPALF
jgi:hypothetical protein